MGKLRYILMSPKVSICIACHNQAHLIGEALESCFNQEYTNIEVIVLDDASKIPLAIKHDKVKVFRSDEPSGSGEAFNKAISQATGDIVVLLCADDYFTSPLLITDIVATFTKYPQVIHLTRYYYQFVHGDKSPVRAWRSDNILELANNPSGLAFRRSAIGKCKLSNKMFVEAPTFVYQIMHSNKKGLSMVLPWDTVAVRVHDSTARSREYYRKRWTSSPIEEWVKLGGTDLLHDFTSFIQIKNYFTTWAVVQEMFNFIKLRAFSVLEPCFWFFGILSILTPRWLLMRIPGWYRKTLGKATTKPILRPENKKVGDNATQEKA